MVETRGSALGCAALSTDEEDNSGADLVPPSTYTIASYAVYYIVGEAVETGHVPRHGVEVSARIPSSQVH